MRDQHSFLRFVAGLRKDLASHPEAWQSASLADYLEALEAWTTDWRKFEAAPNPWRHAAQMLLAASRYE